MREREKEESEEGEGEERKREKGEGEKRGKRVRRRDLPTGRGPVLFGGGPRAAETRQCRCG